MCLRHTATWSVLASPATPRSGNRKSQGAILAPSADKQTRNYDNYHPSLSALRSKGLSRSKMKRLAISTNLPVSDTVRLPHPESGDSQGHKTFLCICKWFSSQEWRERRRAFL